MKVCFLTATFYPFMGGIETQTMEFAHRLLKKGVKVEVVTGRFKGLKKFELVEGIPVRRVWLYDSGSKHSFLQSLTWSLSAFLFLLFSRPYDVYHAWQALTPALVGVLASKVKGKGCISQVANTAEKGEVHVWNNSGLWGRWLKKILLHSDVFLATSNLAVKELSENGVIPKHMVLIPNGVDTDRFRPRKDWLEMRKVLGLPLKGKGVIFVARTEPHKGIYELLEAWKRVEAEVKEAWLIVLGKKVDAERLEGAIKKGMLKRVRLLGVVPRAENYFAASNVFVLPSYAEGLSNSLLEGMSTGLSIVATKVSGTEDLITHEKSGILIPPRNVRALEEALLKVLMHPQVNLGRAARQKVLEGYSASKVASDLVSLYKKLQNE